MQEILKPYSLAQLQLKNRIVMPPMITIGYCEEDGIPTPAAAEHYALRAKGGVGLVIVEAACVSPHAKLNKQQMGIWDDAQIAGHALITAACHAAGAKIFLQLHHGGYVSVSGEKVTDRKSVV